MRLLGAALLSGVCFLPFAANALPTYPDCEGAGCEATAGRGGDVCLVTNLNDAGAGSFRNCVEGSWATARTVIFRTGGTIELDTPILIDDGSGLTIAGQTAPGGGITISGASINGTGFPAMVNIRAGDIYMRGLRLRVGADGTWDAQGGDALSINPYAVGDDSYVVITETTLTWGQDENYEIWSSTDGIVINNITMQRLIVAWGLNARGMIVGSNNETSREEMGPVDLLDSYFAHNDDRNAYWGMDQATQSNTIVYNWGSGGGTAARGGGQYDFAGNVWKPGQDSPDLNSANPDDVQTFPWGFSSCGPGVFCIQEAPSIYLQDNVFWIQGTKTTPDSEDQWDEMQQWDSVNGYQATPREYERDTPQTRTHTISLQDAGTLDADLLSVVGAYRKLDDVDCDGGFLDARDALDTQVVADFSEGDGNIITDEDSVGGFLTIDEGSACTDTDGDGMPDVWETANGLNTADASDRNGDADGDGYTNLEEYLNGVVLMDMGFTSCPGYAPPTTGGTAPAGSQVPYTLTHDLIIHPDCTNQMVYLGAHCDDPSDSSGDGCDQDLWFEATAEVQIVGDGAPRWESVTVSCGVDGGCPAGSGASAGWIGQRGEIDLSSYTQEQLGPVRVNVCYDQASDGVCDSLTIDPDVPMIQSMVTSGAIIQ